MLLSVIVPAYNEAERLAANLEKIRAAIAVQGDFQNQWELIICDNDSSVQTVSIAQVAGASVVSESIRQISRVRNTGAKAAKGQWLLFIDADSYPSTALMAEVLSSIQSEKWIGCGSTVEVVEGNRWNKLRMERLNPLMRLFNWAGGAFLLCQKEAFEAIGGFSEELYALEEIDFIVRLRRYGKKQGRKFKVLHRHPVYTSGRKDALSLPALVQLFFSNLLAIVFLLLHVILPKGMRIKAKPNWLGFWYKQRD